VLCYTKAMKNLELENVKDKHHTQYLRVHYFRDSDSAYVTPFYSEEEALNWDDYYDENGYAKDGHSRIKVFKIRLSLEDWFRNTNN